MFKSDLAIQFATMLPESEAEWERFSEQERHFPKILGSEASWEHLLYIYIAIILKKNAERQISCRIYKNLHICASCR